MSAEKFPVERIRALRLAVFDFDGVFTDNRVLVMEDGREAVWCSRADGLGLTRLREMGLPLLVISMETNPVVSQRCQKLKIECIQGCHQKWERLADEISRRGLSADEVAYMGNDTNDLECLRRVGLPVAVADADPAVREAARIITSRPGGRGAVREFCDLVIRVKTHDTLS